MAVPTHFYKVILGIKRQGTSSNRAKDIDDDMADLKHSLSELRNGKNSKIKVVLGAFVLPNEVIDEKIRLMSFQVPVDTVEASSGNKYLLKTLF